MVATHSEPKFIFRLVRNLCHQYVLMGKYLSVENITELQKHMYEGMLMRSPVKDQDKLNCSLLQTFSFLFETQSVDF